MGEFWYRAAPWGLTLLQHDWPVVALSLLILPLAVVTLVHPRRSFLSALYGLSTLGIAFEYQKHGRAMAEKTIRYLFSFPSGAELSATLQLFLVHLLPPLVYGLGMVLILLPMVLHWYRGQSEREPGTDKRQPRLPGGDTEGVPTGWFGNRRGFPLAGAFSWRRRSPSLPTTRRLSGTRAGRAGSVSDGFDSNQLHDHDSLGLPR